MSATDSKDASLTVRGLLDTLECLINIRDKFHRDCNNVVKTIEDCIVYTAGRLEELNVNTSQFSAFQELERLTTMEQRLISQDHNHTYGDRELSEKHIFESVIASKIEFIEKGSFSRLTSEGGVGPLAALERLAEVKWNLYQSEGLSELLIFKMREVVYAPEPKASPRNDPVMR